MDEGRIAILFASLAMEFRGRWSSEFPRAGEPDADRVMRMIKLGWWKQIHDLSDAEIARALDEMPVGRDEWPPGPRAFRRLARPGMRRSGAHVLFLPKPPPTPEQREAAAQAVRSTLGGLRGDGDVDAGEAVGKPEQRGPTPIQRREFVARHREALERMLGVEAVAVELGEG